MNCHPRGKNYGWDRGGAIQAPQASRLWRQWTLPSRVFPGGTPVTRGRVPPHSFFLVRDPKKRGGERQKGAPPLWR